MGATKRTGTSGAKGARAKGAAAKGAGGKRTRKAPPAPRGLTVAEAADAPRAAWEATGAAVEAAGGRVLCAYRDPLGGHALVLAVLPIERVAPTPFQRDPSPMHVKRLAQAMGTVDRFLDPVIAVPTEGGFWTPNGNHRLEALRSVGARAIVALVVPERRVAFHILALNTEKSHALRERALEVVRMARALEPEGGTEVAHAAAFEDASLLTLGLLYEENGRFPGGAYHPMLRKVETFLDVALPDALEQRRRRAARVRALEERVAGIVAALKARGLESPYLRGFVLARINPLRFSKGPPPAFDALLDTLDAKARTFDAGKISTKDLARSGGAPADAADGGE